jgi:hypothetical protein
MLSSLCGSSFLFMEDCYMCLKPDLFAMLILSAPANVSCVILRRFRRVLSRHPNLA